MKIFNLAAGTKDILIVFDYNDHACLATGKSLYNREQKSSELFASQKEHNKFIAKILKNMTRTNE